MITGGTEAAVTPMGMSGFRRHAGPFRAQRRSRPTPAGPSTSSATASCSAKAPALLVLEELEHAKARGADIYAEVLGYGMSADGGHITQPDKDGVGRRPRHDAWR